MATAKMAAQMAAPKNSYDFSNISVLVVDDCRFMRMVLEKMLDILGVGRVVFAKDGIDAFLRIGEANPDIVISDWEMDSMDGPTFVKRLRSNEDSQHRQIPVIMLTGYTEIERVMEARDSGITEFLAKPLSARTLHNRLCAIVDKPRSFVSSDEFSGPDRRRFASKAEKYVERRGIDDDDDDVFEI